jgi:hypothetical protein
MLLTNVIGIGEKEIVWKEDKNQKVVNILQLACGNNFQID